MFKHFRVILRITPRDIGNFFKAAGRFIKSILPAFLISFSILTAFSMPVLASTSGGLVTVKPNSPTLPVSVAQWVINYSLELGEDITNDFLTLQKGALYWFFEVLVNDSYGATTNTFTVLGESFSVTPHSIRATSNGKNLDKFDDDYFHTYFDCIRQYCLKNFADCTDPACTTYVTSYFYNLTERKPNGLSRFPCSFVDIFFYARDPGSTFFSDSLSLLPDNEKSVKKFFDYLYAEYLKSSGLSEVSAGYDNISDIDDYYKKPVVSGDVFNSVIENDNTLFFPKNFNGKVSYRNDKVWHNKYDSTSTSYSTMEFYTADSGFSAVGGGDEIYLIFFEKLGDSTYYHKYQFHFTVKKEEVWYTDRDEINYINYRFDIEYWDMVDGSADDEPTKGSYYDMNNKYYHPYFRIYFSSASNVNYKGIKFCGYDSYSDYLNYGFTFNSNAFFNQFIGYNADLLSSITMSNTHFTGALSAHDSCTYNGDCDFGYIASLTPISTTYRIDTSNIPDNYYITINGDTIYDYSITNPETGAKDTINNYITNNYTLPEPSTSQPSGNGTGGGNVNVDVDVTVNIGGNGNHYDMPDTSFFDSYLDDALEESTGIRKFIGDFFNTLPGQITQLIGLSIVIAILCRLIGR